MVVGASVVVDEVVEVVVLVMDEVELVVVGVVVLVDEVELVAVGVVVLVVVGAEVGVLVVVGEEVVVRASSSGAIAIAARDDPQDVELNSTVARSARSLPCRRNDMTRRVPGETLPLRAPRSHIGSVVA